MNSDKSLAAYLSDHRAGSVAASDLAKRGTRNNDGPLASFFAGLYEEIEADRRALAEVADQVGTESTRSRRRQP